MTCRLLAFAKHDSCFPMFEPSLLDAGVAKLNPDLTHLIEDLSRDNLPQDATLSEVPLLAGEMDKLKDLEALSLRVPCLLWVTGESKLWTPDIHHGVALIRSPTWTS